MRIVVWRRQAATQSDGVFITPAVRPAVAGALVGSGSNNTQWSLRSLTLDASCMHAPRAKAGHYLASPTLLYNLLVAILFKSTSKLPIALLGGTTSSPFTLECQIYSRLHHSHER